MQKKIRRAGKDSNLSKKDEDKVEYIIQCKKESTEASSDRRKAWKELWSLFQGRQDYRNKQTWQAKAFVPKIWNKIEKASAEVKRALLQIDKLFKMVVDDDADEQQKERLEDLRRKLEKKFKRKIDGTLKRATSPTKT
jgi:hypothetical protein